MKFESPLPPHSEEIIVSFPTDHVLLLTFNRPKALNAMSPSMVESVKAVLDWFDEEPSLWVGILTGNGRAFCTGADLKLWNTSQSSGRSTEQEDIAASFNGFGALSRRYTSNKPLIAAVNGIGSFGGGTEIVMNCDLVVAADTAAFTLPEVKRGVLAAQGVIPRVYSIAGRQRASEMLFLGRSIPAQEAYERFGFVNEVVPSSGSSSSPRELGPTPNPALTRAISLAQQITQNSPDAVQAHKRAILLAMANQGIESATISAAWSTESKRVFKGENIKEGLKAFVEKRKPVWKNPAKL